MLKVLKSKDCKKPTSKPCLKALKKATKCKKSISTEVKDTSKSQVVSGSNNRITNKLFGFPHYDYKNPFPQSSSFSNSGLGYSHYNSLGTSSGLSQQSWYAPSSAPTRIGGSGQRLQTNYGSLYENRLKKLEDELKKKTNPAKTTSTGTGTSTATSDSGSQTEKTHVNKQFTAIEDGDGNITGFRKPTGRPPVDKIGIEMMWNSSDPKGNELWENPENKGKSKIPRGWVERFNSDGDEWSEANNKYEQRGQPPTSPDKQKGD